MTIIIPGDRYVDGYHMKLNWTDSNETVTTSGTTVRISIGESGMSWGIAFLGHPGNQFVAFAINFNTQSQDGMSFGGRVSNVLGATALQQWSRDLSDSQLTGEYFNLSGSAIHLEDIYIDSATDEVVLVWDIISGSQQLYAEADMYLFKGEVI